MTFWAICAAVYGIVVSVMFYMMLRAPTLEPDDPAGLSDGERAEIAAREAEKQA
ncbi:hypothetical protein [Sphingomonas sp. SRS2]|uniref:hypothetical protein n=1 Tax=Sphingomonas sp. SRS2 TaxID=133190 RepID=UPI000A7436F4|nr:hypothetical protein [Sphingomonas sp. SRS2]